MGQSVKQLKEKLWTKDFVLLSLANLFQFFGFQMLVPTIPLYISHHGGNQTDVGLVTGLFTVFALLIRPFAGAALDRTGRKKVLVAGLLLNLLAIAGYGWAASVHHILALRVLHGIGWGLSTTAFGTMASDLIPPSRRGEGMGYFGFSTTLAMAVGPLLGIWILNRFGPGVLFLLAAASTLTSLALGQVVRIPPLLKSETAMAKPPLWAGLFESSALFPSILVMLMTFTYGGIITFLPLFGNEIGIANVGLFFTVNALFLLVARPIAGILHDRKGPFWVLVPGAGFGFAGLLALSHAATSRDLVWAGMLYGIAFGSIQPTLQAWLIQRVPLHKRGAATATFYSAFDLGIGGGAMLLGPFASQIGFAAMYRASACSLQSIPWSSWSGRQTPISPADIASMSSKGISNVYSLLS
ncbi:MFS transporter [Calditerricola satsumensis]|uniref:MFS transporter n=1 Tax=Calditerricola satsumensis TaxID=373054 RepID=UPI000A6AC6C7|nr:MFS transporter [Calditerricola satsumensis]